jgi:hypothetical protein
LENNGQKGDNLGDLLADVIKFEQSLTQKAATNDPEELNKAKEILKETRVIKLGLVMKMKSELDTVLASRHVINNNNNNDHQAAQPSPPSPLVFIQPAEILKDAQSNSKESVVSLSANNRRSSLSSEMNNQQEKVKNEPSKAATDKVVEEKKEDHKPERVVTLARRRANGRIKLN